VIVHGLIAVGVSADGHLEILGLTWLKITGFAEPGPASWGCSDLGGLDLRTNSSQVGSLTLPELRRRFRPDWSPKGGEMSGARSVTRLRRGALATSAFPSGAFAPRPRPPPCGGTAFIVIHFPERKGAPA
jgi:hypothetical protein